VDFFPSSEKITTGKVDSQRLEDPLNEVEEKVADSITGILGVERDTIKPSSRFKEDLDADSLEVIDLIMSIEDLFDIEIPDETAETLRTVGDLTAYIKTKAASLRD
jgi:acyl carrier protein